MSPPRLSWFHRLDTQLVAGFLAASLVPSILVGSLLTWGGLELAEQAARENVARTADAYGADLDLFVQRQRGRLVDLAKNGPDQEALTAAVQNTSGLAAVWDPASPRTSSPAPADWAKTACQELAANTDKDVTHAGAGQAHEVVIAVRSGASVLCGQLTFTLHQEMLTEQAESLLGGQAYIVDRAGTVVCHTFDDVGHHDPRGQVLSAAVTDVAQAQQEWSGRLVGSEDNVVAAYAPSSELPWGVWVEVSESRALGPFLTGLWRSVLVAAAISLLSAGLAVLLARRLGAPVREVARAVSRVAAGELGAEVPVRGPAEVAALAHEFNAMSRALAGFHAELEARVVDRTRKLSEARAFSDRLLDTMHHQIIVLDGDLAVVRANSAAVAALGGPIEGRVAAELPGRGEATAASVAAVLRSGQPRREERNLGELGPVLEVETVPLIGENGQPIGVLEVSRDVTELRQMHARLAHQDKISALGTLAAGLAHEIGNPLASMSSELEMLERMWSPDDARKALPVLREQVRRISRLLRELVDLGRPASPRLSHFRPLTVLDEVARLLQHDPRSKGVEVVVGGPSLPALYAQRDGLVQVLVNLGLNALDAVADVANARVVLSVHSSRWGCAFEVADNGPGLPADVVGRVFDPFFTTKGPGQGTGLGLFVSARIVEGMGGRIDHVPGASGTRFRVYLPASVAEESEE